jgi:hypothetical protein
MARRARRDSRDHGPRRRDVDPAITVTLATDAAGAVTSTAAQVVPAVNASPAASALVSAYTYRTSGTFAGPTELSEPESANIDWVAANNRNLKFSMNLHSSGNYFMWAPGAYKMPGRISAPRLTLEQESFFWGASSRILTEIKRHRGLSVTPARTGPIADVLYSAGRQLGRHALVQGRHLRVELRGGQHLPAAHRQ